MRIEVDSHTHTIASGHAYSTLAENVTVAAARGLKLLAITDHGPLMPDAPHFWYFMNMRVIPRIIDGVGILRGIEANIVNIAGELDVEQDVLDYMDIVLGSLHEPIIAPTKKTHHTNAVIKAMSSGTIDVFAHGGNPSFPIDAKEVAKAATHYNVLIEINNSSFTTSREGSTKNCATLAEAVADAGGYLTFGSDAHIAQIVGGFKECTTLIEAVGFPKKRILSRDAEKFMRFLEDKNKKTDLSEFTSLFKKNNYKEE